MLIDTRQTIHMGVNFVMTPIPQNNPDLRLGMQQSLDEAGVPYSTVRQTESELLISREKPNRLNIKIGQMPPPVGHLLIVAPFPERPLDTFAEEAETVVRALEAISPPDQRRLVSRDATLRDLYDTGGVHGFQEIWETLLGQQSEMLQPLGRPVRGGGLRFVMPPLPNDPEKVQIDLRVESYLKETTKIFIEARFTWPLATPVGAEASPRELLGAVEAYITQSVWSFMGAQ